MPFTLEVMFTGILSFAHPKDDETTVRVLVPNTLPEALTDGKKALDDEELYAHYPYLWGHRTQWLLARESVQFDLTLEQHERPPMTTAISTVPSMRDIWGDALDPDCRDEPAKCTRLAAFADLEGGALLAGALTPWEVPGHISGKGGAQKSVAVSPCIAQAVVWRVAGVTKATVRSQPFDGDLPPRVWPIADQGGVVRMVMANLRTRPGSNDQHEDPPETDDPDFRWHYELFSEEEKNKVREKLASKKLPVPRAPQGDPDGFPDLEDFKPYLPGGGLHGNTHGKCDEHAEERIVTANLARRSPTGGNCMPARWF